MVFVIVFHFFVHLILVVLEQFLIPTINVVDGTC